ncbi:PKD domain-containing protein [Halostella sp. JP-L12]|uniref:PKD domain-containing protein n=1 Tax=Halostella TaxID=1843185 RepID=UPI0013CE55D7|nr:MULTISPECIES: PKD domain-containing protein [Halostella]NHN47887.1 PKD domain-containing protein [Halostella sp. JP-L12]
MTSARRLGALCAAAMLLLSATTAGVGGALATAPPAANEGEIEGCTVIDEPGSYEFTGDVETNESGPCIEIRTSDVSIDGNGYFLSQTGPYPENSTTDGVYVNGTDRSLTNVTVENMTVENWRLGVYYERTSGGTVSDVRSLGNLYGVRTLYAEGLTVADSEARYNSLGFTDRRSENLTFRNNSAVENKWGYHFEGNSTGHALTDNYAAGNSKYSFYTNYVEEPANYAVENLTMGEGDARVSVDFEGGRSTAFRPTESPPAAPGNMTDAGAHVELSMTAGGGTSLDAFTVRYANATGVDESTLTLWQHDGASWTEFDDPNAADPAANAVTAEGIVTSDVNDGSVVVAPLGEESEGVDPNASLDADPAEAAVNETVTLDASGSTAGDDAAYEWDVDGDGSVDETTANATTTHAYAESGEYEATVTVVDDGREDAAATTVAVTDSDGGNDGSGGSDGSDGSDDGDTGGSTGGVAPAPSGGSAPAPSDDGDDEMTVDVESDDGGVTATVENGENGETIAVDLAEHGVNTSAVAFENLSTTLAADADGNLSVDATEASPLSDDAATDGYEPVSYLSITDDLGDGALENGTFSFSLNESRIDADAEHVTVQVYRDGEWRSVETNVSETDGERTYSVDADGFSVFSVGIDRPAVGVTALDASESSVETGDEVTVQATLANDGAVEGTTTATLQVDGEARFDREVTVPANGTVVVTFSPQFEKSGERTLSVGDATATVTVEERETATETTADATTTDEESGDAEEASTTGQPGFGLSAALVALVAAALVALRRRR